MNILKLAPICLFAYNRFEETKQTIEALKNNFLASQSDLYIFSDGWKDESSKHKVLKVRALLKEIKGFKSVTVKESKVNKGLANSIIHGVTEIICLEGKVIVLEDDLVSSPNFLNFMNEALDFYRENDSIFSISGYSMFLPSLKSYKNDYYLGVRASSWGWATWRRSWTEIDWEIKDYASFSKTTQKRKEFNVGGSDMTKMLANQMNHKIDSWAIRWCYNQFKRSQYTVFPKISKLINIGFGANATHTKSTKRFDTILDKGKQTNFNFSKDVHLEKKLVNEFKYKFSILARLKEKLLFK